MSKTRPEPSRTINIVSLHQQQHQYQRPNEQTRCCYLCQLVSIRPCPNICTADITITIAITMTSNLQNVITSLRSSKPHHSIAATALQLYILEPYRDGLWGSRDNEPICKLIRAPSSYESHKEARTVVFARQTTNRNSGRHTNAIQVVLKRFRLFCLSVEHVVSCLLSSSSTPLYCIPSVYKLLRSECACRQSIKTNRRRRKGTCLSACQSLSPRTIPKAQYSVTIHPVFGLGPDLLRLPFLKRY